MRKRVRELESALNRSVATLARERKERHDYQLEEKRRIKEDEETMRQWRREMEMQMARVRKEAQEQALKAQQGTMNELSALEQEAKVIQERERQQRIELLRRQVGRRMLHADLSRGWTAWHGTWTEAVRQRQLIRKAGSRIAKPAMSFAYGTWKRSWDDAQKKQAMAKARQREALAGESEAALAQKIEKLREHYELRLSASEEARQALSNQLAELGGSVAEKDRLLQQQESKAREERVELLRRQIVRRIMNQGITRGWSAWSTLWQDKKRQRHQLQQVANRLRAPEKSSAFTFWRQDWEKAVHKAKQAALKQKSAELDQGAHALQAELNRVRDEYQRRFEAIAKERDALREQLGVTSGDFEVKQRQQQQELERQKEQRVKHLTGMIARRIMKKDLARGWTAWHGMWEEKVTAKRKLQAAASRMKAPELANAFGVWSSYSLEARSKKNEKLHQEREASLGQGVEELKAELTRLRSSTDSTISILTKERDALREQLGVTSGDFEVKQRQQQQELERQKEQRVKHLTGMIARRIMKKDLARGWTAWHGMWEEKVTAKRKLQAAASRMKAPELANAFGVWSSYSLEARSKKNEKLHQEREASLGQGVAELKAQLARVHAEYEVKLEAMTKDRDRSKKKLEQTTTSLAQAEEKIKALNDKADEKLRALSDKQRASESELAGKASQREAEFARAQEALKAQLEEQLRKEEAENAQRIEHLKQMIARRIMRKDLARGWTAWFDMWEAAAYQRRQLQKAASSLRLPERSAAFKQWRNDWNEARLALQRKEHEQRVALLQSSAHESSTELERVRFDLQRRLDVSEAARRELMERLTALDGGVAEAELKAKEYAAQEKEKRVEHLCGMIARRILRRDLTRGWTAWFDMWEEKITQRRKLQAAASRLRMPEMAAAYASWRSDWEEVMHKERLRSQRESHRAKELELAEELERVKEECRQKVDAAERSRAEMLAKLTLLDGGAEMAEEALRAQLDKEEREKEKRVQHLCQMIAMRILRKDLARGWTAWLEKWEEASIQKRKLAAAASRLRTPELAASFAFWLSDFDEVKREAERAEQRRREQQQEHSLAGLEAQLEDLKVEMALKLAQAEKDKKRALEDLLQELLGSHESELKQREAREKEVRIEQMQKSMGRRMMNLDLTRGWTTWWEWYSETVYHARLMRMAGGRMGNPGLASSFSWWVRDTQQVKKQAEREAEEKKKAELESSLRSKALEAGKLSMINVAQVDELKALRDKAALQANDIQGKKAALQHAEQEHVAYLQLQEMFKTTKEALAAAQKERDEAKQHVATQQAQSQELLTSLLNEQRAKVANELESNQQKVASLSAELKAAKEESATMLKELAALKAKMTPAKKKEGITLSGKGTMPEQIAEALKSQATRVMDLFRSWDRDGDGEVSRSEFHKAIPALGIEADKKDVDELFNMWDADGGGSLAYKELKKLLSGHPPPKRKSLQLSGEGPMSDQLADALKSQATRVMDLFRSWDRDGDGEVSRAEFHKAIPALGLTVPKADVDALFNQWDADGGGALNYKELRKILSTPKGKQPTPSMGGAAKASMAAASMVSKASSAFGTSSASAPATTQPPPIAVPKSPADS